MGMGKKRLEQHKKPGKPLETVDPETGEVLKGAFVFIPEKHKSPFGRDWFAVAQDALTFLAKNRKTLGEEGFAVFSPCRAAGFEKFHPHCTGRNGPRTWDEGVEFQQSGCPTRVPRYHHPRAEIWALTYLPPKPQGGLERQGQGTLRGASKGARTGLEPHRRRAADGFADLVLLVGPLAATAGGNGFDFRGRVAD